MSAINLHHGKEVDEIDVLALPDRVKNILVEMLITWKKNLIPEILSDQELRLLEQYVDFDIRHEDKNKDIRYFEIVVYVPKNEKTHRQFAFLRETCPDDDGYVVSLKELRQTSERNVFKIIPDKIIDLKTSFPG